MIFQNSWYNFSLEILEKFLSGWIKCVVVIISDFIMKYKIVILWNKNIPILGKLTI